MEGEDSLKGWPFYIHFPYSLLLLFVGVPGNLAIIYYFQFKLKTRRRSSYNLYITYIAFVDLIVCLFRFIPYTLYLNGVFAQNKQLFYIMYFIPFVGSDVSLWGLWGLSSNRLWKFTKPMKERLDKRYIALIPLVTSVLIRYPYDIFLHLSRWNQLVINIVQFVTGVVLLNLIPIVSTVILYKKTVTFLLRQSEFSRESARQKDIHNQNIIALETMKALTISMIITVAIPRTLLVMENGISIFGHIEIGADAYEIIECLAYNTNFTNNAINVFIYYKLVRGFRGFIIPRWLRQNRVEDFSTSQNINMEKKV